MSTALKLTVPDGVPFIDFEREFDFPSRRSSAPIPSLI